MEDGGGLGGDILHGGTIAEILVCVCGVDVSSRITKYILSLRSEWSCVTDVLVAKVVLLYHGQLKNRTFRLQRPYIFWRFLFVPSEIAQKLFKSWWAWLILKNKTVLKHCFVFISVRPPGLEPGTQGLKVLCSTS